MKAAAPGLLSLMVLLLGCAGCDNLPGRPGPGPEVLRPEQMLDFVTLYGQNCAGCHGADGKSGSAVSLADPMYLAFAGEDALRRVTSQGVAGKMMPPFGKEAGGSLTDQQIDVIVHGMTTRWGGANALGGLTAPPYAATTSGDPAAGKQAFDLACARCHAEGSTAGATIRNASYLALVSDQSLRSTIVAGRADEGMPDWRHDVDRIPLTDQQINDIVAWLAAQRTTFPGQPYAPH